MPSGRLILVRHGEIIANQQRVFANSEDIPLSKTGRRQSEQLAQHLGALKGLPYERFADAPDLGYDSRGSRLPGERATS